MCDSIYLFFSVVGAGSEVVRLRGVKYPMLRVTRRMYIAGGCIHGVVGAFTRRIPASLARGGCILTVGRNFRSGRRLSARFNMSYQALRHFRRTAEVGRGVTECLRVRKGARGRVGAVLGAGASILGVRRRKALPAVTKVGSSLRTVLKILGRCTRFSSRTRARCCALGHVCRGYVGVRLRWGGGG